MRRYTVRLAEKAKRTLAKVPQKEQAKIMDAIEELGLDPRPRGYVKLKGCSGAAMYRIQYGNYRIIYTVEDAKLLVLVVEVGDRKDIYR